MQSANLMQEGNFIDIFLARHASGTYAHHQEEDARSHNPQMSTVFCILFSAITVY